MSAAAAAIGTALAIWWAAGPTDTSDVPWDEDWPGCPWRENPRPEPDCNEQWDDAYRICRDIMINGTAAGIYGGGRGVTGRATTVEECARQLVTPDC